MDPMKRHMLEDEEQEIFQDDDIETETDEERELHHAHTHVHHSYDNDIIPSTLKQPAMCSQCHQPKNGQYIRIKGKRIMLPHNKICDMKCTSAACNHRSHKKQRKGAVDKAALLAGFKPPSDTEFAAILNHKLRQAGLSNSLPSPSQLQMVISAAHDFASSRRASPTPAKTTSTSTSTSSSMNSVLRHLESSTAAAIRPKQHQMQCLNCSFVFDSVVGLCEGTTCVLCKIGTLAKARPGAVTNYDLVVSGIEIAAEATRAAANMVKLKTATQTLANTSTTTTTTSTTSPAPKSSVTTVKTKPTVWPPGKKCDVCQDSQATQYCVSCKTYICHMVSCVEAVHDEAAIRVNGCSQNDICAITTKSGRRVPVPSTSKLVQKEVLNDMAPILPLMDRNKQTQTETATNDVGTQTEPEQATPAKLGSKRKHMHVDQSDSDIDKENDASLANVDASSNVTE